MDWFQARMLVVHGRSVMKPWPYILERKNCKHGHMACMMVNCTNCCDDILHLWMYDLNPTICRSCWSKFLKSKDNKQEDY